MQSGKPSGEPLSQPYFKSDFANLSSVDDILFRLYVWWIKVSIASQLIDNSQLSSSRAFPRVTKTFEIKKKKRYCLLLLTSLILVTHIHDDLAIQIFLDIHVRAIKHIVHFSSTVVFECVSCIKKTDFLDIALSYLFYNNDRSARPDRPRSQANTHTHTHTHYELILLIIKGGKCVRETRIVLSNKRGRHGFQCFHYDWINDSILLHIILY